MENIIYGLEFNSRTLCTQQDAEEIRFFIGTQIINGKNQIHMIEIDEESNKLHAKIFSHDSGEVWKLTSCPNDKLIASVYTTSKKSPDLLMQTAIMRIPDIMDPSKEFLDFADVEVLGTESYGSEIKTTEFHPSNTSLVATIVDGKILLFNRTEAKSQVVAEMTGKKFSGGMWSNSNQFVALFENGIRSFDIRDPNHIAWQIECSTQPVRDIDVNPNKAFHIATGDDSGCLKIFDVRNSKDPVFSRRDHLHWIFRVTFNKFHDQLILTSSSDGKVLLTCANSCSSEAPSHKLQQSTVKESSSAEDEDDEYQHRHKKSHLDDGLLETFESHEESVYCVEWSAADPWIFASVSYDGRVVVSRIPKKYKYQILL